MCYEKGLGIKQDEKAAVSLYRKAAEQNHAGAQCSLGICYEQALLGIEKNEKEAVIWYHKAAEQNHADAQYRLGQCYRHGRGVEKDEKGSKKVEQQSS